MKKISLNHGWSFAKGTITMMDLFMGGSDKVQAVDLPHDAMIYQPRTPNTANAHQTGFYPGGEYTYLKQWEIPAEWAGHAVTLEFEGVADRCRIYINGNLAVLHHNPYTGIFVNAAPYLHYGQTNEIKVEVRSIEQSSRWYSGAGIYRDVYAWIADHDVWIPANGLRVTTKSVVDGTAELCVEVPLHSETKGKAEVEITLCGSDGTIAAAEHEAITLLPNEEQRHTQLLTVKNARLWSDEDPYLYMCEIKVRQAGTALDSVTLPVGIRTLGLNAEQGFLLNGKPVKLRGTCIHHDNGVIGAATFSDAEERRCRQLKAAGFNAIRSSHHPMSKAMLAACDRLGMLVMDELSDMWTRTKNPNDYANFFADCWQDDVISVVEKDYNHPCVILYSTGNEIPEAGTPYGAALNRKLNAAIKALDSTRYTTCGINGLMAGSDKVGEMICQASGMSMEELAAMSAPQESGSAGADEVNSMATVMVGPLADAIATCPIMEDLISEFAAATDIAGYNYLTGLHEEDHRRHPNRTVLGTETFPADIVNLWAIVQRNAHVLGDFTWTGYDYLGEAGCGVFHYDGGQNFSAHWPDRLAGIGDIDILGDRKPISYLREAVYGLHKVCSIGVERMDKAGLPVSKTPWMWKDNIASWTWPGYEGQAAQIDVYANATEAELFLNGVSMGRKPIEGCIASFTVPYQPGTLAAVCYEDGHIVSESKLHTSGEPSRLSIETEVGSHHTGDARLAFVKVRLADAQGRINRFERREITVKLEGNAVLQGFGSADPSCEGSYQDTTWLTYDGAVMAVVRGGKTRGQARLTFSSPGLPDAMTELNILS